MVRRLVHVVVHQRIVEAAARDDVEAERRLIENEQTGVDGHGERQMHHGLHALRQLADAPPHADVGLGEQRHRAFAAESRMHAGHKIDGLLHAHPSGQHGDVRDEARLAHEQRALGERLAAEHAERALVGREPEHGTQRRGLARTVRSDEADDASRLHDEVRAIKGDKGAVSLGEAARFDEGW